MLCVCFIFFFFSSRRRHTRLSGDWSSDVCSSDLYLLGEFALADGTPVKPAFQLLKERVDAYTPEWAAGITGIPVESIRRLAHEMGITARDQKIELPIAWTDTWGVEHESVTGNTPLAVRPNAPLDGLALGWPAEPDDLFVDDDGAPVRIDKAFSWEYPLAVHGLMHNVITKAWRGDPYPIDTLLIFMANMAWNSTMNTSEVRTMLNDKRDDGEFKIPFVVVCDAFASETTAFADLVLPDTTYLERHDVMSILDRPISEFDGPVDSVRIPVLPPTQLSRRRPAQAGR